MLPPEAVRELNRIRRRDALRQRAQLAAANAAIAALIYALLHPPNAPPEAEEDELRRYLSR